MIEVIPNWHPVFVHFPIALVLVAVGLHLVAPLLPARWREQCLLVAHWNLWLAVGALFAPVASGWHAFNSVDHDAAGHAAMLEHRRWALITSGVVVVLAVWAGWRRIRLRETGLPFLGVGQLRIRSDKKLSWEEIVEDLRAWEERNEICSFLTRSQPESLLTTCRLMRAKEAVIHEWKTAV